MPHISESDLGTSKAISRWKEAATEEMEIIGRWRHATDDDRLDRYWVNCTSGYIDLEGEPDSFYRDTARLMGLILSKNLDAQPVQEIHAAITKWHVDRDGSRLPSQDELIGHLKEAIVLLGAIDPSKPEDPSAKPAPTAAEAIDPLEIDANWAPPAYFMTEPPYIPNDRLRAAAQPRRKSMHVRSKVVDGVTLYCISDARRWWPRDFIQKKKTTDNA